MHGIPIAAPTSHAALHATYYSRRTVDQALARDVSTIGQTIGLYGRSGGCATCVTTLREIMLRCSKDCWADRFCSKGRRLPGEVDLGHLPRNIVCQVYITADRLLTMSCKLICGFIIKW